MYYIKAIGAAFAPTQVDDVFLGKLNSALSLPIAGVRSRRSILKPEYIAATKNQSLALARENCLLTVADLAAQASRSALQSAGLTTDSNSLLIADTLTPWQITPSEAQRIAFALDLKITSFDIGTAGVSFPTLLQVCQSWSATTKEQQVLLCAVNAPSLYIDYAGGSASGLFSDAAVTMLLSQERKGFEVIALAIETHKRCNNGLSFSPFQACAFDSSFFSRAAEDCIVSCWTEIAPALAGAASISVGINDYGANIVELFEKVGCTQKINLINTFSEYGDSVGCVAGLAMWQWSKSAKTGEVFVGCSPGCGQNAGVFVVKKL